MRWPERSIVSIRKEFVQKALSKNAPIAELCRAFGISRKTGYKWSQRFRQSGRDALVEDSRRLHSSPVEISGDMTLKIIRLRGERVARCDCQLAKQRSQAVVVVI